MTDDIEIKYSNENIDYLEAIDFMKNRVIKIIDNKEKELIWFLYHDHIYTCGTSSSPDEILSDTNIKIFKSNRGGKTTYHGPGQRIIYFLINLNKRKRDIRKFINLIQNTSISLLKQKDIEAKIFPERVGIWVIKNKKNILLKEKKIGAIGLRVSKWVTSHGLSFNLHTDLSHFNNIIPCGLKDYECTSIDELNCKLDVLEFDEIFLKFFLKGLKTL